VRTLGVEREEALQLSVALRLIGKTTEEYTGVIFKLERQLRTNEERLNQLGIKTRDVHGEYLKGPEIFKNALAAMQDTARGPTRTCSRSRPSAKAPRRSTTSSS
jgi:hypothetical protein